MIESIVDGHNDALRCFLEGRKQGITRFLHGRTEGHVDLARARRGGLRAGFFALQIPPDPAVPRDGDIVFTSDGYEVPLAHPMTQSHAWSWTRQGIDDVSALVEASQGELCIIRTLGDLELCLSEKKLGIIIHLEGADPIDSNLENLAILHQAGLRSLGIVWSRPNIFGTGVPFRFPHSPDTGPGLTEAGRNLVRRCNELGIMLDASHLNERGFWDLVETSRAPLVASHSSVHALCRSSRNLTDPQLDAIRDSSGLVGVNFEVCALRADGNNNPETPIEVLLAHIDYLIERVGIDGVGFGSDFDGATMSTALPDVGSLPTLVNQLRGRYGVKEIEKLCRGNWIRVLRATWIER